MFVERHWDGDWHSTKGANETGRFLRWDAGFRNWITSDGSPGPTGEGDFAAEAHRYHLIVANVCP